MPRRLCPIRRTGLTLLGVWLLALLLVAAYTIKLLLDEDQINAAAREHARSHALGLLAGRIEATLGATLRAPATALKNLSLEELDNLRMQGLLTAFFPLRRILLLDHNLKLVRTFPNGHQRLDHLLTDRVRLEGMTRLTALGMRILVEPTTEGTLVLTLTSLSDICHESYLLLEFDLASLIIQVQPLFDEFGLKEKGQVTLLGANEWNETAIQIPLNRILPGYFLAFTPESHKDTFTLRALPVALSLAVVLAMSLASWAAFREVRRSHAVAEEPLDLLKIFTSAHKISI